jgi:hypothetical protein
VFESFPTCSVAEVARLGRTLRAWRDQFLAYFITGRASNGGTEAINGIIELRRRIARGFRNPRKDDLGRWTTHPPKSPMSHSWRPPDGSSLTRIISEVGPDEIYIAKLFRSSPRSGRLPVSTRQGTLSTSRFPGLCGA